MAGMKQYLWILFALLIVGAAIAVVTKSMFGAIACTVWAMIIFRSITSTPASPEK
jgi:hypothetical protein